MTHLVFICGHAGTGKTTLAKRLIGPLMKRTDAAFCLLDKDTLYGPISTAAIGALTGDPHDRDSPLYLQHLRDPEYRGLIDTARDNLELGIGVIAIGPLSREVRDGQLFDRAWLGVADDVEIHVVWVSTTEDVARERIVARGNPADAYKLAHWDDYRQRRFVPDADHCDGLLMFDNTAPTAADHDALLAQIAGVRPRTVTMLPPMPV